MTPTSHPIIDKMFCINLDHRTDRWQSASRQFEQFGLDVERISGVDGRSGLYESPGCDNYNNACTLSHLKIIENSASNGLKTIMVFEDDVILNPLFHRILADAISELPENWDLLYAGGNHVNRPVKYSRNLMRATKVFTTHAYILRSTLFEWMIRRMKLLYQPVDCFFAEAQKDFNCFICDPRIAYQRKGYSDIQHREVNYNRELRD